MIYNTIKWLKCLNHLKDKIAKQNKEILELKSKIKTIEWKIETILANM